MRISDWSSDVCSSDLIVGPNGVLTGEDVSGREPGFFMTRIDADAIVRPETTEEISQILALCNSVGQPIVVQGGMSGWVRATQTRPGEIILSLERMNAIESVEIGRASCRERVCQYV